MLEQRGEEALIAYLSSIMTLPDAGADFMRALYRLSQRVTNGVIVELGAYVGRSAIALAWDSVLPVYSIDDYSKHVDWSGRAYGGLNEAEYKRKIEAAQVYTTLVKSDVQEAGLKWTRPIGLLVWDVSEPKRLYDDWLIWREHIVIEGFALLRDTFDKRLGSDDVINYEYTRREFMLENTQPGLLTLRRYG